MPDEAMTMGKFVITGITVDNGEVVSAHVQGIERNIGAEAFGTFGLTMGDVMDRSEIAALTLTDDVHVVKWTGGGEFELGSRVSRKPGQEEFLVSIDPDGTPNEDLMNVAQMN